MNRMGSMSAKLGGVNYSHKYTPPLLITGILLAAHLSFGILESYPKLITAIVASFATELMLHRLIVGTWRDLSSAYISGISVGILIRSPQLWPFALCAAISIASKYVLRFKDQHIWNPSNFGVVMMLLLAPQSVAVLSIQWGNNMWAMLVIWIVGSISIYRLRRFHICATYVISFLAFALVRSWISGDPYLAEVAPITGPMYQLFTFFMITDPKTTVHRRWGQYVVIILVAFVEMILRLNEAVYAPFYALFIVGPLAMMLELWWDDRNNTGGAGDGANVSNASVSS
ncbi:NQR2, RnfD, RnfE family [Fodinibius roseus]|uniref:NQR2, RnfD, RnfE family n=2 Tax=Fodinibius roseus TaxID=1194090 RepID=A0A1M5F1U7_9BACT|nr:NQR2, RnfD, RnfE family [Fodinibius roseus]